MKISRSVGATSQILQIFIADSSSTTGAGLTGIVFNTSGLTAYFHRDTDTTATAISLVTMTAGTFTSSGFKEIDSTNMPGWYQFCPPNTAFASGASSVSFHLKGVTNMAPLPIEVDLDTQVDTKFWNGTAVSSPATAGIPDVNVKNINNVAATSVTTIGANVGHTQPLNFTGTAGSALVKVDVTDIATAAVATGTAQLGVNVVNWGATAVGTVPPDVVFIRNGTAQAGASSTITLDAGASATDNFYQNCVIFIRSGTGAGQSNIIATYVGSTKVATVSNAWVTNPSSSSVFTIAAFGPVIASVSGTVNANVTAINSVSTSGVTAVAANIGTAQPVNFTGTSSSALVKSDMQDIAGSAVSASTAQLGVNLVNIAGSAVSTSTAQLGTNLVNIAGSAVSATTAQLGTNLVNIAGSAVSTSTAQLGVNVVSVGSGAANIYKNKALGAFPFIMTDATTHAPKTGLTVTGTVSIDGGAFGSLTNSVTETSSGWYQVNLAAADLNGSTIALRFTGTGADDTDITIVTVP